MLQHNQQTQQKTHAHSDLGCTNCFNALGVDSRMAIYRYLKDQGKSSVSSIVNFIGLTQPTVSYHLNEMKTVGILNSQKAGKEVFYSVSDTCKIYHQECVLKNVHFPA